MTPVSELAPYAGNARTHSEQQVAQIAASITEFGFVNPILAGPDNGIIAGHGRLLAAQLLGIDNVPVIVLDHLGEAQRRALVIADNKIAENAGWDDELLRQELAALQDADFDLSLTGFDARGLDEVFAGFDGADEELPDLPGDPDFVPDPPARPVSELGMIWELGRHRVICGDATKRKTAARLVDGRKMAACWTDPPYNVDYEGTAGKIRNDSMADAEFRKFLVGAFRAAESVMKAGAAIYVAHADTEGFNFRGAFIDAGFKLSGCLVWVKPSLVLGRSDYQWRHEPILYGWKPGAPHRWFGGRAKTTVMDDAGEPVRVMPDGTLQIDVDGQTIVISGEKLAIESATGSILRFAKPARNAEHPTMKPVALIEEMLGNSTVRGDAVYDPFGGSGSTLVACEKTQRICYAMELDERFVDVIVTRWQALTGRSAVLQGDGRTFEEVAARAAAA